MKVENNLKNLVVKNVSAGTSLAYLKKDDINYLILSLLIVAYIEAGLFCKIPTNVYWI